MEYGFTPSLQNAPSDGTYLHGCRLTTSHTSNIWGWWECLSNITKQYLDDFPIQAGRCCKTGGLSCVCFDFWKKNNMFMDGFLPLFYQNLPNMLDVDNSSLLLVKNQCRGTLDDAKRLSSSSSRLVKLVSTSGTIAGMKPYCWTAKFAGFQKHDFYNQNTQDSRSRYRMRIS